MYVPEPLLEELKTKIFSSMQEAQDFISELYAQISKAESDQLYAEQMAQMEDYKANTVHQERDIPSIVQNPDTLLTGLTDWLASLRS